MSFTVTIGLQKKDKKYLDKIFDLSVLDIKQHFLADMIYNEPYEYNDVVTFYDITGRNDFTYFLYDEIIGKLTEKQEETGKPISIECLEPFAKFGKLLLEHDSSENNIVQTFIDSYAISLVTGDLELPKKATGTTTITDETTEFSDNSYQSTLNVSSDCNKRAEFAKQMSYLLLDVFGIDWARSVYDMLTNGEESQYFGFIDFCVTMAVVYESCKKLDIKKLIWNAG